MKKAKKLAQMDMEALRKLVEKEEAEEKETFQNAKNECIKERQAHRRAKSERASAARRAHTRGKHVRRKGKA